MEPLTDGQPGPHESWRELATASIEHIDLHPQLPPPRPAPEEEETPWAITLPFSSPA